MLGTRLLIGLVAFAIPVAAKATALKNYDVLIEFLSCSTFDGVCGLDDPVTTGTTYRGFFSVDAANLAADGYINAGFESFYLQLGEFIWDSLNPLPGSDYVGSRFYNPDDRSGGFGPWTLLVEQGEVTGICCGVYGIGDIPFVDLYSWSALELSLNQVGVIAGGDIDRMGFSAFGTFSIVPISEPPVTALGFAALLLIASCFCSTRCRYPVLADRVPS